MYLPPAGNQIVLVFGGSYVGPQNTSHLNPNVTLNMLDYGPPLLPFALEGEAVHWTVGEMDTTLAGWIVTGIFKHNPPVFGALVADLGLETDCRAETGLAVSCFGDATFAIELDTDGMFAPAIGVEEAALDLIVELDANGVHAPTIIADGDLELLYEMESEGGHAPSIFIDGDFELLPEIDAVADHIEPRDAGVLLDVSFEADGEGIYAQPIDGLADFVALLLAEGVGWFAPAIDGSGDATLQFSTADSLGHHIPAVFTESGEIMLRMMPDADGYYTNGEPLAISLEANAVHGVNGVGDGVLLFELSGATSRGSYVTGDVFLAIDVAGAGLRSVTASAAIELAFAPVAAVTATAPASATSEALLFFNLTGYAEVPAANYGNQIVIVTRNEALHV